VANPEQAEAIMQQELGRKFVNVLEDAGVLKDLFALFALLIY